jgi:type IV pilus assembly protein PilW
MNSTATKKRFLQRGFSLIEIMVALALGAIILLGVAEIFTNNSQTRAEIERTGRQIESGSYALGVIESDLTNAGFWGEAGEQPAGGTLPPVCPGLGADLAVAAAELGDSLGYPVQGEDALLSSCISPKAGTEFISVRRAASCALGSAGCDPADSNFYLQVNACFEPSDSSLPLPGILRISTVISDLDYTERDCATTAPQYRLLSRVYFVNDSDQLVRAELSRASGASVYVETPLVEGVETMKFEYGIDTDGDGQVDVHTDSPSGTQWADVAMVRVYMVVRNLEPSGGYSDTRTYVVGGDNYTVPVAFQGHKRQVYARTVSLRNVAGRREAQ